MKGPVIDAHCHALGLDVEKWRKCSNYREMQATMRDIGLGHPEAFIESMDRFGIDKACIKGGFGVSLEMQLPGCWKASRSRKEESWVPSPYTSILTQRSSSKASRYPL